MQKQDRKSWEYLCNERRYNVKIIHSPFFNQLNLSNKDFDAPNQIGYEKRKKLTVDRPYYPFVIVSYHFLHRLI